MTTRTPNEFEVNPNACVACCTPCRICLAPISGKCRTDHLFFRLHSMPWRTAYGKPAGWFRCCSPLAFLCTRAFLAVFWLAISVWSLADSCPDETDASVWNASGTETEAPQHCALWITKLTHWTLLLELFYLTFAVYSTYMAIYDTKVPDGVGKATPWFISVTYAMQPTALVGSLLVFLLFWLLVYEPPLGATSAFTHGANFAVMLLDFLLALDWSDPGGTGRLAGLILFLGIPILWVLLYCLFLGRRCHRVSTSGRSSGRLPEELEVGNLEPELQTPSV